VLVGGHTITDEVPKYGLAVTGVVHPDKVITNAAARPGDVLILTKSIGAGVILAGKRLGEVSDADHQKALDNMKVLNREGARIMQQYRVRCATDITGFGLMGHAMKLAQASGVTLNVEAAAVPLLNGAIELAEMGCFPGACFRNLDYVEASCEYQQSVPYELKMLMHDAQTSGGLLMAVSKEKADAVLDSLLPIYPEAAIIGSVSAKSDRSVRVG
jgi:selenide,water dikinase